VPDFDALLLADVLGLLLFAAGVARGHVLLRRRPAPRPKPPEGTTP